MSISAETFTDYGVPLEPLFGDLALPPSPAMPVYWHPSITIPKAMKTVFEDYAIYATLCDFCRDTRNLRMNADGQIVQALCERCRAILGRHESNQCAGGSASCMRVRHVDATGAAAPYCRECYQESRKRRRPCERRQSSDRKRLGRRPAHLAGGGHAAK